MEILQTRNFNPNFNARLYTKTRLPEHVTSEDKELLAILEQRIKDIPNNDTYLLKVDDKHDVQGIYGLHSMVVKVLHLNPLKNWFEETKGLIPLYYSRDFYGRKTNEKIPKETRIESIDELVHTVQTFFGDKNAFFEEK